MTTLTPARPQALSRLRRQSEAAQVRRELRAVRIQRSEVINAINDFLFGSGTISTGAR